MIVDETIIANSKSKSNSNSNDNHHHLDEYLGYDQSQHPLTCQIGGNDPTLCGRATAILQQYRYDAIDFNIDCPSQKVAGEREFGAVLLHKPELALAILTSIKQNATHDTPISIKTRIGIDDHDDLQFIAGFIHKLKPVCTRFVLHARKCVLGGLMNARQNRSVPPLNYPRVYALCRMFPSCDFWINGGIRSLKDARDVVYGTEDAGTRQGEHAVPCQPCNLPHGSCTAPPLRPPPPNLRGCMLGRAAVDDPCLFWDTDRYFYGEDRNPCRNRGEVLQRYCAFLERTYPRRCSDDDERITHGYPAPTVVGTGDGCCAVCRDVYGEGGADVPVGEETPSSPPPLCSRIDASAVGNGGGRRAAKTTTARRKIASRIVARSLKPVQGLFAGVPNTRIFRRTCDRLSQDRTVRNCGPGYILRKAMESVPDGILGEGFVRADASDAI